MDPFLFVLAGAIATLAVVWAVRRAFAFAGQEAQDYVHLLPELDLQKHLTGRLVCRGMIFGPTGRVTSRFTATMEMSWDGPKGSMVEHFLYDDGTVQDRVWLIQLHEDGRVETEATDVLGHGTGRIMGNALGLRYAIQLPPENGSHVLQAVDWMYLQEDGTILNRSQFRKFGIKVAELFAVIRPMGDDDA
ncbi:DUF3833 family protein [Jannaschia sp. GRR-S6-38]|uniref:DUF3833 family protein n=2 Tax=Jannaschia ovalis TaxID=3038773 RepID=A0ABY8LGE7_9RHOB|nr:DUF3833 family protein [Jannaschia sp. GRR-S6-38]WGH80374.1 DUF3833 family protein [Jannaschia sp. GRR-S6-38]